MIERRYPAMGRAVLEQQHARQRPALAPLAVRTATPGLGRQTRRLQRKPGHGVTELVAVPFLQLLVKMLHSEIAIELLVKPPHPRQFRLWSPTRRSLAKPPIMQSLRTILVILDHQPAEMSARHAKQLASLLRRQPPLPMALQRLFKPKHENLPYAPVRRIAPSRTGSEHGGQLTRYERRTTDASPTIRLPSLDNGAGLETWMRAMTPALRIVRICIISR